MTTTTRSAPPGLADATGIDTAQTPGYVTVRGRRGGSAMASSAVNALASEVE